MHVVAVNLLLSMGRSREVFRLDVAKKFVLLAALAIGLPFGAVGVAWAQVGYGIGASWINSRATARAVGYSLGTQARDGAPPVIAASVAAAVAWCLAALIPGGNLVVAVVAATTGVIVYLAIAYLFRVSSVLELVARTRRLVQ